MGYGLWAMGDKAIRRGGDKAMGGRYPNIRDNKQRKGAKKCANLKYNFKIATI